MSSSQDNLSKRHVIKLSSVLLPFCDSEDPGHTNALMNAWLSPLALVPESWQQIFHSELGCVKQGSHWYHSHQWDGEERIHS